MGVFLPVSHPIIFMIVSAVFFVFSNILFALLPLIGSVCLNALPLAAFIRYAGIFSTISLCRVQNHQLVRPSPTTSLA